MLPLLPHRLIASQSSAVQLTSVDENYPHADHLRYLYSTGGGVKGGRVRIYPAHSYDIGDQKFFHERRIRSDGSWSSSVSLPRGDFVAVFDLPRKFGKSVRRFTTNV